MALFVSCSNQNKTSQSIEEKERREELNRQRRIEFEANSILYQYFDDCSKSPFMDSSYLTDHIDDYSDFPKSFILEMIYPFITIGDFYILAFEEERKSRFNFEKGNVAKRSGYSLIDDILIFKPRVFLEGEQIHDAAIEIKIKTNSAMPNETIYLLVKVKDKTMQLEDIVSYNILFEEVYRFNTYDVLNNIDNMVQIINSFVHNHNQESKEYSDEIPITNSQTSTGGLY